MWKKVIAPTVLVSLLWIAVSTTTTYFLHRLDGTYTQVLYDDREIARAAITMQGLLWRTQAAVTAAGERGQRVQNEELERLDAAFRDALAEATRATASKSEPDLTTEIGVRFSSYMNYLRAQASRSEASTDVGMPDVPAAAKKKEAAQHQAYAGKAMALALSVNKSCERLFEFGQQLVATSFDNHNRLRAEST